MDSTNGLINWPLLFLLKTIKDVINRSPVCKSGWFSCIHPLQSIIYINVEFWVLLPKYPILTVYTMTVDKVKLPNPKVEW